MAGYGLSTFARAGIAAAPTWGWVLGAKIADRIGKGTRGAPRDALIRDSTPKALMGSAFGYHRSADTVGAIIGPLLAALMLALRALAAHDPVGRRAARRGDAAADPAHPRGAAGPGGTQEELARAGRRPRAAGAVLERDADLGRVLAGELQRRVPAAARARPRAGDAADRARLRGLQRRLRVAVVAARRAVGPALARARSSGWGSSSSGSSTSASRSRPARGRCGRCSRSTASTWRRPRASAAPGSPTT